MLFMSRETRERWALPTVETDVKRGFKEYK
jgi:hypothetical protein